MFRFMRVSLSAFVIATLTVAPATLILTADVAVAKNGNGGGNSGGGNGGGNGNGNSGGNDNASKGSSKSTGNVSKTSKGTQPKSKSLFSRKQTSGSERKTFGSKLKGGFGLFKGQKQTAAKASQQRTQKPKAQPQKAVQQVAAKEKGILHPSKLGKLNGMINSSPKAKLAHLRNGNLTGTVGIAAALALAEHGYNLDAEAYDRALGLLEDPATQELAAAFDLIDGAPTAEEIAAAEEVLATADPTSDEYRRAEEVLDYPDTTEARALTEGVDEDAFREELAEAQAVVDQGAPDDTEVTAAREAVLDAYNGELTPEEEEQVLDAVRAGFPTDEEIASVTQSDDDGSESGTPEEDDAEDGEESENDDVEELAQLNED